MSWLNSLLSLALELRRRKVVRATLVYLGGGMVVIAAGDALIDTYNLPDTAQTLLGWAVLAGLPVTVALAWFFDWTDDGLRMADRTPVPVGVRRGVFAGSFTLVGGIAALALVSLPGAPRPATGPIAVAVLSFEAASPDDALTAVGLQAGVESALSGILDIVLIPGSATAAYPPMPLDSLARRVGADYFLKSTVLPGGDKVHLQILRADMTVVNAGGPVTVSPPSPGALYATLADSLELKLRRLLRREVTLAHWDRGTSSDAAFEARLGADRALRDAAGFLAVDPASFEANLDRADSLLAVAGRHDRNWAEVDLARVDVAERRALGAVMNRGPGEAVKILDRALAELERFLRERGDLPAVRAARGRLRWLRHNYGRDAGEAPDAALLAEVEADLRKAAQDDRTLASAAAELAELYRYEREDYKLAHLWALEAYERDAYLEERPQVLTLLAESNLELGDDPEASRWCQQLVQAFPHLPQAHTCRLDLMAWGSAEPRPDAAWSAYQTLSHVMPGGEAAVAGHYGFVVAAVLARAGLPDSARAVLDRSRLAARTDEALWLEAAVRFRLGDDRLARERLREFGMRHPGQVATVFRRRALRDYALEPSR